MRFGNDTTTQSNESLEQKASPGRASAGKDLGWVAVTGSAAYFGAPRVYFGQAFDEGDVLRFYEGYSTSESRFSSLYDGGHFNKGPKRNEILGNMCLTRLGDVNYVNVPEEITVYKHTIGIYTALPELEKVIKDFRRQKCLEFGYDPDQYCE